MPQKLRQYRNDYPLKNAGDQKRAAIRVCIDQILDNGNEQRGACAEPRCNDARSQTTPIWKPLQRGSDATTINKCSSDSGERIKEIQLWKRRRKSQSTPPNTAQNSRGSDELAWTHPIYEPAVNRLHERLKIDKDRESQLHFG